MATDTRDMADSDQEPEGGLDIHDAPNGVEDEIGNGFETDANPRTDVLGMMVPIGWITGWQGGDPPADWLVRSVAKRLHNPILVRETGKKRYPYEVVDGRRRLKALRENGAKEVPVVVDEVTDDLDMLAMFLNSARSDNMAHSAMAVKAKLDAGLSDKDIALAAANGDAKLGKNILAKVRALRDIATKLHPELFKGLEDGRVGGWAARMAARQPEAVQLRMVERLIANNKLTPDDVIEERRAKQIAAAQDSDILDAILSAPDDLGDEDGEEYDSPESRTADRYQGATTDGQPSIPATQRKASAIRLLTAAAKELGFIQGEYTEVPDCIGLIEDVITTLQEMG